MKKFDIQTIGEWQQQYDEVSDCAKNAKGTCISSSTTGTLNLGNMLGSMAHTAGQPKHSESYCKKNPDDCKEATAMTAVSGMLAAIYLNPPASGLAWTRETLANAGLISQPAYAQGIGFAALTPFLPLWTVTRNIAYTLIIVIMIVIGFMIMFRAHIDPQTVISVQAALPKIVLTMILITFSYAIVGFMVDIMYLSIAIIVSLVVGAAPSMTVSGYSLGQWQADMMTGGLGTLFTSVYGPALRTTNDFAVSTVWGPGIVGGIGAYIVSGATFFLAGPLFFAGIIAAIPALLLVVIFTFGLLFIFIRLLMLLVNSYIQLIISLILGPILLLNEAIPGRSGFKDWILNILANLSVFPATAGVLLFASYLASADIGGNWAPPFLGTWNVTPGGNTVNFTGFLGLAVVFVAPNLVGAAKKAFQAKPSLPVSAGTIFAPITNTVSMAMQQAQGFAYGKAALGPLIGKLTGGQGGGTP